MGYRLVRCGAVRDRLVRDRLVRDRAVRDWLVRCRSLRGQPVRDLGILKLAGRPGPACVTRVLRQLVPR